jgi:transglutaminase-like putative cysteine protease
MLECLLAQDDRPLTAGRPVDTRLVGVCRHFTVLLAGMLRAQGVIAGTGTVLNALLKRPEAV